MILAPQTVAQAWLDLQLKKMSDAERRVSEWVNDALDLAIYHDAEYALQIIEAIHHLDPRQETAELFAAGPLENLLTFQGAAIIDRIEKIASKDPAFAFVLGGVYRRSMPDPIWERILKVRVRKDWDGI